MRLFSAQLGTLVLVLGTQNVIAFLLSRSHVTPLMQDNVVANHWRKSTFSQLGVSNSDDSVNNSDASPNDSPVVQSSTIKIDDGGSYLTDRFKYKVQALMGNFDPADSDQDTEANSGNILNAMMQFPTEYTFHVVGKHAANDEPAREAFVQAVVDSVRNGAGLRDDAPLEAAIVPRSSKFVKVSVVATVESVAMVTEIYESLRAMPECVMQF